MNTRSTLVLLFALSLVSVVGSGVLGCGTAGRRGVGNDASIDPGVDAAVPGEDAFVPGEDAFVPLDDAGDPLNAPPACTSGRRWAFGNAGSALMNPGLACIACHDTEPRAPGFTAAGTVYPTGHEPDLCNAPGEQAAVIELHDATGRVAMVSPNSAGNFYYQGALTLPLTASIHYMGRTREMTTPATSGDCNSCHTQDGTMSAPGRITLP